MEKLKIEWKAFATIMDISGISELIHLFREGLNGVVAFTVIG